MINRNTLVAAVAVGLVVLAPAFAQSLQENYNDFLHYLKIGRFDLAAGYAKAILDSSPEPVELFNLASDNPQGYALLLRAKENLADAELAALCGKMIDIIERGRFVRRSDPKVIVEEIARLSTTDRGRLAAIKRLNDAGEYAVMYMLDALADQSRRDEWPNIADALGRMSRQAIRPLVAALQTDNVGVKAEIIKALGKIGYPQSLPYLKFVAEKDDSPQLRTLAEQSIGQINPASLRAPAAHLFYRLGEDYYYHADSLAPAEDANFANIWFWNANTARLTREEVDKGYFSELMAMRCCEWALKADPDFGRAIGLWVAGFFKAESFDPQMPPYCGPNHADAMTYATTAGAEYLHQALARAIKDKDAQVALGVVEALSTTAGECSLFYRLGPAQPLAEALSFDNKAVSFSAAIAIAAAGPMQIFPESRLVMANLAEALTQSSEQVNEDIPMWNGPLADSYALRAAKVMLKLAVSRNPILDLSEAETTLIAATKDKRDEIQMLAGQILAHLKTPTAQQAVAAMALSQDYSQEIRLAAFNSLSVSAKLNGCLLDDTTVDAIYSLVASEEIDPDLRSAAAAAYGALNLPSEKVKNLILDQARR